MTDDSTHAPPRSAPVVVGIGELLWDQSAAGRRCGGAPANFASHAGQLGAEAWVVSAVGNDAAGEDLVREAQRRGARLCVARVEGQATGRVDVVLDAARTPSFAISAESAWDHVPWTDATAQLAARADAACFGSLAQRHPTSRASIRRFLDAMQPSALRVLDVNLRPPYVDRRVLLESLDYANVLKASQEEWQQLMDWLSLRGDFFAAGRALCERFDLRCVIITLGERGSRMADLTGAWRVAAEPITPVDSVGAGDAFAAACCLGLLGRADPDRILSAASKVAGYVCTQHGGAPTLSPALAEVARQMLRVET